MAQISNGESGLSVRNKLNTALAGLPEYLLPLPTPATGERPIALRGDQNGNQTPIYWDGAEWRRFLGGHIYQPVNDGVTDEYAAIQAALAKHKVVLLTPGVLCVSRQFEVPTGGALIGSGKTTIIKALGNITLQADGTWPMGALGESGQARCMVRARSNAQVRGITFDGNNFKSGGVMVWFNSDVEIEDVWVINAVGAANNNNAATSAVNCNQANRVRIRRLHAYRCRFATQLWLCNDCEVVDSDHDVGQAGFWTTGCNRVKFINCTATNQNDVGLDFEGGTDCIAEGGYATRCRYGELSLFWGDLDGGGDDSAADFRLQFRGTRAHRVANYTDYAGVEQACDAGNGFGSLWVSSITAGSRQCGWYGCDVTVDYGRAIATADLGATSDADDREIEFVGNKFTFNGGSLFRFNVTTRGLLLKDNTFVINANLGSSEISNPDRTSIVGNHFIVNAAQDGYLFKIYQNIAQVSPSRPCLLAWNRFYGPEHNQYAVEVEQFDSTGTASPDPGLENLVIQENSFSEMPAAFGGLYVHSGSRPIFRNQKLRILIQKATGSGAVSESLNTTTVADFSYTFYNTGSSEMGPYADGLLILNQRDGVTGALDASVRNAYKVAITPGGGQRILQDIAAPLTSNGGPNPGGIQAAGSVSLNTSGTTTSVSLTNMSSSSVVVLTPTNAAAATEIRTGDVYVSAKAGGSFTITHPVNAASRTFDYVVLRSGTPGFGSGSGLTRSTSLFVSGFGSFSQEVQVTKPTDAAINFVYDLTLESRPVLFGGGV